MTQVHNYIKDSADRTGRFLKRYEQHKPHAKINGVYINCWYHKNSSHSIYKCNAFMNLSHEEELQMMRQHGACFNCLQLGHIASSCHIVNQCDKMKPSGQICGKRRHPCLHLERTETTSSSSQGMYACNASQEALLAVSEIMCNDKMLSVLRDSGANISLITHKAAASANLQGKSIELSITKVGNQNETIRSKRYLVPLTDQNGKTWNIFANGIKEITSDLKYVNVSCYAVSLGQNLRYCQASWCGGRLELTAAQYYHRWLTLLKISS